MVDYSRWDNLDDDSDEEPQAAAFDAAQSDFIQAMSNVSPALASAPWMFPDGDEAAKPMIDALAAAVAAEAAQRHSAAASAPGTTSGAARPCPTPDPLASSKPEPAVGTQQRAPRKVILMGALPECARSRSRTVMLGVFTLYEDIGLVNGGPVCESARDPIQAPAQHVPRPHRTQRRGRRALMRACDANGVRGRGRNRPGREHL